MCSLSLQKKQNTYLQTDILLFSCTTLCIFNQCVHKWKEKKQIIVLSFVVLFQNLLMIVHKEIINCFYCGKVCIWLSLLMTPKASFPCLQLNLQQPCQEQRCQIRQCGLVDGMPNKALVLFSDLFARRLVANFSSCTSIFHL